MDTRVQGVVALFEHLTPQDLPRLADFYTPDARFKDPFNEVQGTAAITAVFAHMFEALDGPRFVIRDTLVQGDQCFLSWDFVFRMKRDYWDAAEELYEKLPLVGGLMRWLKQRARS